MLVTWLVSFHERNGQVIILKIAEAHKLQLSIAVEVLEGKASHKYVDLEGTCAMCGKLQASVPRAQSSSPWASSHQSLPWCPNHAV